MSMSVVSTTRTTNRSGGRLHGEKPGGVCLNRKDLRSVREVTLDHYDAEYLYLRENELTVFDADVKMEHLRVLDISINDIGGAVNFLEKTPRLRHLYMTGNKIDTLVGIANFASLETLCLSDNAINGFEGLQNLPSLRVLSLNFNNISSFEAYPNLPNLHTLNLVGNPITEILSYRSMAIAINCPDLVSIDGNPVQEPERAAVEHFQGKIVHCIREGFVVEGDNMEEAADAFLLKHQRTREASKYLQLCTIRLASQDEESNVLMEGIPVSLSLCMQDIRPFVQRTSEIFHSRQLYPVIFKVSGEATEVFVVGSMNNWTDPIELERCEEEGEIYFHTTLYLPAGDYEYRYIVDGVEKVSETNRITSKYKQGFCNLYQVTELEPQEEDPDTILHIRWMRSTTNGVFELIDGVNGLTYTPTIKDIGCCMRVEVLAYVNGEFSFLYFDVSSPIVAAPPSCPHLEIKGIPVEGSVLRAYADYVGGVEGNSSLAWFRVAADGTASPVEVRDPWAGYKLSKDDLGCRVRVEFTPLRNDWVAGVPKSVETEVVVAGNPECQSIRIVGNLVEGTQLEVDVEYTGGAEGDSFYQWLHKADGADEYIPIEGENGTKYVPTLEDVGKCLAVEYTPVNAEGREGETCRCVLENPIEPSAPQIHNLAIVGDVKEDHTLTIEYDYTGGHFGPHMIQWYRRDSHRRLIKIGQANKSFVTLGREDVGCSIEVSVTPVRSDGVTGKSVHAKSQSRAAAGAPQIRHLAIIGTPAVGEELVLEVDYTGGEESASIIRWQTQDPETEIFDVVAEGVTKYVVKREDGGKTLRATYIPIREDGVEGDAKSHSVQIAAARAMPGQRHVDPVDQEEHEFEEVAEAKNSSSDIFEEGVATPQASEREEEEAQDRDVDEVEEPEQEPAAGNIKIDATQGRNSDEDSEL